MRFLVCSLTAVAFAILVSTSYGQNPFDSSQPGYPKGTPFTGIEWKDETTVRVEYENEWYDLQSVEGITVQEMVQKCKTEQWDHGERIAEDLPQLLRLMGRKTGDTVKLTLINGEGKEIGVAKAALSKLNRRKIRKNKDPREQKLIEEKLFAEMAKRNPFFSGAPGYSDRSPFSAIKWEEGKPAVRFRDQWYHPVTLQGVSWEEIVKKCKTERWELKRRFTEDMVQILRLMGQDVDETIDMELLDKDGKTHEFKQVKMSNRALRMPREARPGNRSTGKFDVASVQADLDSLQNQLESQFAYLKTNNFDYVAAIDEIRANATDLDSKQKLGLAIEKKVINQFIDGHASVSGAGVAGEVFLPFLIEVSGDRYVAINEDRENFVDKDHPYIQQIDGKSIDEWIEIAEVYSPKGSSQYRRRHGLRMLRVIPQLRSDAKLPESNTLSVVLAQEDGSTTIQKELELSEEHPTYGLWPRRTDSRLLDEGFGYLRIPSMNDGAVEQIQQWMPKFKDTNGIIVDVRGNGGGIRTPLLELTGYLMQPGDAPRVGNIAKYKLCESFDKDHLSDARYVYRESSSKFDNRERAFISDFKKTFQPEWEPNENEFSEWHYMVLAKREDDRRFYYNKPVIILCDEKCFSATDIFLGAFKGWPNVTLMGQASGGGSARSQRFQLENTGISIRCASMASFQPDGKLYDTHGVEPDVLVTRTPSYFLNNGEDVILQKAIETLFQQN